MLAIFSGTVGNHIWGFWTQYKKSQLFTRDSRSSRLRNTLFGCPLIEKNFFNRIFSFLKIFSSNCQLSIEKSIKKSNLIRVRWKPAWACSEFVFSFCMKSRLMILLTGILKKKCTSTNYWLNSSQLISRCLKLYKKNSPDHQATFTFCSFHHFWYISLRPPCL